jgi:hypothetical protein
MSPPTRRSRSLMLTRPSPPSLSDEPVSKPHPSSEIQREIAFGLPRSSTQVPLVLLVREASGVEVLVVDLYAGVRAWLESGPEAFVKPKDSRLAVADQVENKHSLDVFGGDRCGRDDEEGSEDHGPCRGHGPRSGGGRPP